MEKQAAQEIMAAGYLAGYMQKEAKTPLAGGFRGDLNKNLGENEWATWSNAIKKKFLANPANSIPEWMDAKTINEFRPTKAIKPSVWSALFGL